MDALLMSVAWLLYGLVITVVLAIVYLVIRDWVWRVRYRKQPMSTSPDEYGKPYFDKIEEFRSDFT